jgi:hypothetical protein
MTPPKYPGMRVLKVAFQIQPAMKLAANMAIIVISNLFQNGIFFSKLLMGGQYEGQTQGSPPFVYV